MENNIEIKLKENFYKNYTSDFDISGGNVEDNMKNKILKELKNNKYKCPVCDKKIKKSPKFYVFIKKGKEPSIENINIYCDKCVKEEDDIEILATIIYSESQGEGAITRTQEYFINNNVKQINSILKFIFKLFLILNIVGSIISFVQGYSFIFYQKIFLSYLSDLVFNLFNGIYLVIIFIIFSIFILFYTLLKHYVRDYEFNHHYYDTRKKFKSRLPYSTHYLVYIVTLILWFLLYNDIITSIGRIDFIVTSLVLVLLVISFPVVFHKTLISDKSRFMKKHNKNNIKEVSERDLEIEFKSTNILDVDEIEKETLISEYYNIPRYMFLAYLSSFTFVYLLILYLIDYISFNMLFISSLLPLIVLILYYVFKKLPSKQKL